MDSRFHLSEHNGTIARSAVLGLVVDHPSTASPDYSWTWSGVAVTAAGLIAAALAAAVRRRRIAAALGPPPGPAWQHPDRLSRP